MFTNPSRHSYVSLLLLMALLLAACQPIQAPAQDTAAPAAAVSPLLGNLGNHTHPITTQSALAQKYFDEGLILTFAFNHAEAIRSYQDAIKLDPTCAMCYWGVAYALGPNINAPMDSAVVTQAWDALQKAVALAPQAGAAEQAYIQALSARYSNDPNADRATLDHAYANAMHDLAKAYPDDADAATLFAESLMDLMPWNFWTKEGQPTDYTNEIVATLEGVLATNPDHPGANHYYIHAVEASPDNQRAIPSADRLTHLVPGAGHLVHMPGHTYWRVGRYHDAVIANEHAIHSDESYLPDRGIQLTAWYPAAYYNHNIDFLLAASQMEGNSQQSIAAATKLVQGVPEELYEQTYFEYYKPLVIFALARFGKWDEILQQPQPAAQYQYTTGAWHYARGLAFVRQGALDKAAAELAALQAIAATEEMKALALYSFATAEQILQIEAHALAGELATAQGDAEQGITELEAAVEIQDSLAYIEPPAFYYPVRQTLGALLLAADRPVDAEAVYRADLAQYPQNGWSLFGLEQSLTAQGKSDGAAEVQKQFEEAWQHADVTLTASRF
ncbi:MAG: hypothetical protein DYG89_00180 [Caldilinea sp. CFX5]|nr:hypothetical protein [Caldilinea sp. CFX5]